MTRTPKFLIKTDRELDQATIIEFMSLGYPIITQVFPHFTSENAVKAGVKNVYEENRTELDATVRWLERNTETLRKLAVVVSELLNYT
jgi:hypothetical protein